MQTLAMMLHQAILTVVVGCEVEKFPREFARRKEEARRDSDWKEEGRKEAGSTESHENQSASSVCPLSLYRVGHKSWT